MSSPTPRRDFLARLATLSAATAVSGACAPATHAGASTAPAPRRPANLTFDDSWTTAVSAARHKAVFDSPDVADGLGVWHVATYLRGYKTVFDTKDGEVRPVLVLRHEGTVLAMDDALWAKYDLGRAVKYKEPKTKRWYTHNPVSRPHADDEKEYVSTLLEGAIKSGVTVLACNQALTGFASQMAEKRKLDRADTIEEFRRGLVPGVILQPSGVYATMRAQEVGCVFMRST
jgi:intracellular sulfur oxidation DsrE/DsrF family protein